MTFRMNVYVVLVSTECGFRIWHANLISPDLLLGGSFEQAMYVEEESIKRT